MVIKPSEQTDSGGPTLRGVVRLRVANAVLCQAIQVGRLDLTSITSEIGIPHVVRKNYYQVRTLRRIRRDRQN